MTKRLEPPKREDRPPIPAFTPVPRRYRHDGWTPERQVAFIHALAETGCVDRAARMVNIAQTNCYTLRRAPGAEEFRRAWDAALDFTVPMLKDIAFKRAIEGELVPVFSGGKLMGYRRKFNDRLLMFILRHYGQDADGKRVTVNYFSTRASAGAGSIENSAADAPAPPPLPSGVVPLPEKARGGIGGAEASMTSVRTVISGGRALSPGLSGDEAAAAIEGFEGVALDPQAQAEIAAALEACAARARAAQAAIDQGGIAAGDALEDDPDESFIRSPQGNDYRGTFELMAPLETFEPFIEGESHWELAGEEMRADYAAWLDAQEAKAAAGAGEGKQEPERGGARGRPRKGG